MTVEVVEPVLVLKVGTGTVTILDDTEGGSVTGTTTVVGLTSTEIAVVGGTVTGIMIVVGLMADVVDFAASELATENDGTGIVDAIAVTPTMVTGSPISREKVPSPELQSQMPSLVSGVQHHFWFPHEVNEPLFRLTGSSVASQLLSGEYTKSSGHKMVFTTLTSKTHQDKSLRMPWNSTED
ncbi:hypothetical protein MMC11_005988 [Xylographa trunciseda]|nr:hypothetical protein [Xylographa trunciseda]